TGTAQWKAAWSGTGAALLDLQPDDQPFNLALGKPRFDNRDAVLARFPRPAGRRGARPAAPARLALLLGRPGEPAGPPARSARGTADGSPGPEPRPGGLQGALRLPSCPLAPLELDLPAVHSVASLDGALVSGPHTAEAADRRVWRVVCGGRGQLPLMIRTGEG